MRLHASFFTILICVAPAVGLTDGAFPNDQLSTRLFARNDAPVDAADVFSNVAVFYYVKPADGNIISDALNRDAIPYTKRHYIRPEHERALSNALICGPDTPVQAIKKVALALINAGVDLKYIGTKGDARPRQVSILSLFRKSYTINYVNITREQVIALSECPSELKNKAAPKAVEATAPSSPSTTAQIISPTPATSSTLEKLQQMKRFWEEQVFYCKVGPLVYPSKNDNVYDPSQRYDPKIPKAVWEKNYISESASDCDDGDMVFFSSMLCAAGDNRGCTMVASSQDKSSGRWWRSKRRIGESDTSDHASFSTEQGLGVYNYMVKKADKSAFSNWLEWIDANPRIYAPLPSYCTHKECVFKVIDCPLLVTVASHFNLAVRATSVCNPLRALDLPDPGQLEKGLQDALNGLLGLASKYEESRNKLIGKIGEALGIDNVDKLLPAPIKDLQAQANGAIQAFKDAREKILGPQIGEAAARLAQAIALLNSAVNGIDIQDSSFKIDTGKLVFRSNSVTLEDANITIDPGKIVYNPNGEHIAAVEVFMLRNLGYQSDVLNRAAEIIDERDKDNPFFEYLAHGRSDYMLELIVRKCPSRKNPYRPSTRRFQWFPERGEDLQGDTQQTAYAESMYWDCLFLSDLYERDIDSSPC